ncbi:nucleotide binding ubiquitin-protein ligase, putative, partial [Ichthyophthirius multifiliis]
MSWNYCAFSGEQLTEPMVSKKTGHVFQKRIIQKYVQSTGQCPITQQSLSLDDLIPIKSNQIIKSKTSQKTSSVPQILQVFQSEWDSLLLENYNLKQNLEQMRQQLSYALYQHDAACRVISRLLKEREEFKKR